MKYKEIKDLTTEKIRTYIENEKDNLRKAKFSHTVSSLENPLKIKSLRKTIARLKTELIKRKQDKGTALKVSN